MVKYVSTQLFADESKRRGFVMVAVEYRAIRVAGYRSQLRHQLRPGQRRIHFKKESNSVRRQLLALITAQQPQAHIYVASVRYEPAARADCLKALVRFAVISGANRLVIERDETRADDDRDVLTQSMRAAPGHVPWEVSPPAAEPMLWVADAIAWCWNHPEPRWRSLVAPMIVSVTNV